MLRTFAIFVSTAALLLGGGLSAQAQSRPHAQHREPLPQSARERSAPARPARQGQAVPRVDPRPAAPRVYVQPRPYYGPRVHVRVGPPYYRSWGHHHHWGPRRYYGHGPWFGHHHRGWRHQRHHHHWPDHGPRVRFRFGFGF